MRKCGWIIVAVVCCRRTRGARSLALGRDDSDRRAKSGPSQPRRGRVTCYVLRHEEKTALSPARRPREPSTKTASRLCSVSLIREIRAIYKARATPRRALCPK